MTVDVKKQGTRNCKTEPELSIYKASVCYLTQIPKNQKYLYFPTNPDNLISRVRSKISFQSPSKSTAVEILKSGSSSAPVFESSNLRRVANPVLQQWS